MGEEGGRRVREVLRPAVAKTALGVRLGGDEVPRSEHRSEQVKPERRAVPPHELLEPRFLEEKEPGGVNAPDEGEPHVVRWARRAGDRALVHDVERGDQLREPVAASCVCVELLDWLEPGCKLLVQCVRCDGREGRISEVIGYEKDLGAFEELGDCRRVAGGDVEFCDEPLSASSSWRLLFP